MDYPLHICARAEKLHCLGGASHTYYQLLVFYCQISLPKMCYSCAGSGFKLETSDLPVSALLAEFHR